MTTALMACSDSMGPVTVSGAYSATSFTAVTGSTTSDVLAAGGFMTVVLTPQGTTTGRVFVPASLTGGSALDADLAGTWAESDGTVHISGPADTFVRDMPFTVQGTTLVGDKAFGDMHIRVTLSRHP